MDNLCPGIRRTVEWLQSEGFKTTDSGDGVSNGDMGCAMPFPNVFMVCSPASLILETHRLYDLLQEKGIEARAFLLDVEDDKQPPHIEATYDPSDGIAGIALFNVDDALLFDR